MIALDILCRIFIPHVMQDVIFRWDMSLKERGLTTWVFQQLVVITLNPLQDPGESDHAYCSRIVTTILHEICHAFTMLFVCRRIYCGDWRCSAETIQLRGASGHGIAWLHITSNIHIAARKHMSELDIGLGPLHCSPEQAQWGRLLRKGGFESPHGRLQRAGDT